MVNGFVHVHSRSATDGVGVKGSVVTAVQEYGWNGLMKVM